MEFGEAAHQGQPQSRSPTLPVVAVISLSERLEDAVDLALGNAGTVVGDDQFKFTGQIAPGQHVDGALVLA